MSGLKMRLAVMEIIGTPTCGARCRPPRQVRSWQANDYPNDRHTLRQCKIQTSLLASVHLSQLGFYIALLRLNIQGTPHYYRDCQYSCRKGNCCCINDSLKVQSCTLNIIPLHHTGSASNRISSTIFFSHLHQVTSIGK